MGSYDDRSAAKEEREEEFICCNRYLTESIVRVDVRTSKHSLQQEGGGCS